MTHETETPLVAPDLFDPDPDGLVANCDPNVMRWNEFYARDQAARLARNNRLRGARVQTAPVVNTGGDAHYGGESPLPTPTARDFGFPA